MILRSWLGSAGTAALLSAFALPADATAAGGHAALSAPSDLAADGAQAALRGKPVIILFSLPGCPFCEVVRQHYLVPLMRDLPEQQRPIVREVEITAGAGFSGFHHEPLSHRELARNYGVRFAPTVLMLDRAGKLLAPPIVGGDTAGFYGGYLDNALDEASRKLTEIKQIETNRGKQ